MEARLLDFDFEKALRVHHRERVRDRSRGRHLSDCIHYYLEKMDPKRFGGTEIDPVLAHGGFIWEDLNSRILAEQFGFKPNQIEISLDRIYMTLDGFKSRGWKVLEFKNTKISASNPIRSAKFRHWHMQMMGYCMGMDSLDAELYVRFENGSYELAGGRFGKPIGRVWDLHFTRREILENWDLIRMIDNEMTKEEMAA